MLGVVGGSGKSFYIGLSLKRHHFIEDTEKVRE